MIILPQSPGAIPLEAVAGSPVASGTVRVFSVVSGSEVNALGTTALVNVYGNVWRYNWTPAASPIPLPPGIYIAYYVLTDASGATWTSTEDLIVPADLVIARQFATNRWKINSSTFVESFYDDDSATVKWVVTLLASDGSTPTGTNPFERHP